MQNSAGGRSRVVREFSLFGFIWRFACALALVLLTYNPSGFSFFHWALAAFHDGSLGALHYFLGVLLAIGWAILLVATSNSLGPLGLILGVALFGTLVWLLIDLGLLEASSFDAIAWIVLVCLAGILTIGLSWSHIWRRMTGQFDTDDSDE